jgi:hypothetical protein
MGFDGQSFIGLKFSVQSKIERSQNESVLFYPINRLLVIYCSIKLLHRYTAIKQFNGAENSYSLYNYKVIS